MKKKGNIPVLFGIWAWFTMGCDISPWQKFIVRIIKTFWVTTDSLSSWEKTKQKQKKNTILGLYQDLSFLFPFSCFFICQALPFTYSVSLIQASCNIKMFTQPFLCLKQQRMFLVCKNEENNVLTLSLEKVRHQPVLPSMINRSNKSDLVLPSYLHWGPPSIDWALKGGHHLVSLL